jgi:hypothetical protein
MLLLNTQKMNPKRGRHLSNFWRPPYQLEPPINHLRGAEIQEVINGPNPKKSDYDLITS